MSPDPQLIRAEPHTQIGLIIQRDATTLIERWSRRAVEEQPNARRVHHEALLDHLSDFLQALGRSLMETDETTTRGHCRPATVHGGQRWEAGWSLAEVVRDYQILRLVLLDYLEETPERPLENREVMAIGLALDEAITASIVTYTTSRDEHLRQLEEKRVELDRKVQEFLRSQAEALRRSDRRKNEFLATLAHELRNPLAPLGNAVGVLRRHPTTDPIILQIRDIFDRQVQQMARLLDDLLDVSRIAQGKVMLQKEAVSLAAVVGHAVQMNEPLLKARELHFEVVAPTHEVWLEADPIRLAQIIVNLVNNAGKYTERGGRVWLTLGQEDAHAVLRVRDTGAGIAPELLPHIFDLFTQAEWPVDRSQGGLGIGLALVRRLVELHGGAITASSPGVGNGSEFVVRLPALSAIPPMRDGQASREDKSLLSKAAHRRILVVDDNVDAAESLALLLQVQGHSVEIAHDGPMALHKAEDLRPEVVLLDIGLPRLDGYEVARQMREQAWGNGALIVALTGYGQDEDRQRSAAAGFNAHLVKPIDLEALYQLLAHARDFSGSPSECPGASSQSASDAG
jgi:signal transduction histidine kinase/ActR/RegA family two-component response regulator